MLTDVALEHVANRGMDTAPMADSTRNMRRSILNREVLPHWRNRLLSEITPGDLRAPCKPIVDRGAPATDIHVRDIVKQIYAWAILHGEKIDNPADGVGPASIATFRPRDRNLSPTEIRIMLGLLGEVATLPTIRLGLKVILLSMVRKSELQDATLDEVDFANAVWSIPKERMKRSRPHNVYLSSQMLDMLVEEGRLEKVSGGLYLAPRQTRYGKAPARPEKLVESFLKDDCFLLVSPNAYNGLRMGTTQLYNEPVVYNLKRHGRFDLGGRVYDFRKKSSVPSRLTKEVLLVDLLQNVDRLAESRAEVLPRALHRARSMNAARLFKAARDFGSVRAERLLNKALQAA